MTVGLHHPAAEELDVEVAGASPPPNSAKLKNCELSGLPVLDRRGRGALSRSTADELDLEAAVPKTLQRLRIVNIQVARSADAVAEPTDHRRVRPRGSSHESPAQL